MVELTSHAIDFTLNTRWENLPAGVQHQARRCLMDTLGAMIAGSRTPVADIMRKTAREQFGGDQAIVFVGTRKGPIHESVCLPDRSGPAGCQRQP